MRANLKLAIIRAGLTQRHVARRSGLTENRLSSIIHAWVDPRPEEQDAILSALGRTSRSLFRVERDVANDASDAA